MDIRFDNVAIAGIAVAVPATIFNLQNLALEFGSEEIKRISMSTGIENLRPAKTTQRTSDFCLAAAKRLLTDLALSPSALDAIIFISQTPDYRMPATSCILQNKLGMKNTALAFDINYGCSAYIYGLLQANLLINSGMCQRVLLCTGDTITQHLDPADQKSRLVFGDGGSATILEKGVGNIAFNLMTDGSGYEKLIINKKADGGDGFLFMDGAAIMEFVLREVPKSIDNVLSQKQWKKTEVNLVLLHQANKFIVDYLRKKLHLEKEKVPIAVEGYGNTGPASIPLILVHNRNNYSSEMKQKVIMSGFGVGLSWGSVALNISKTSISQLIEI